MVFLDPADRSKLAKLLGMLGSDQPGEVVNAAKAAHRLVQARGLAWDEILAQEPPARETSQLTGWRLTVDRCLRSAAVINDWEFKFLSSLSGSIFPHPTPKQQVILDRITVRVLDGQS
jgi:hypothetical protein